ncbi:hypothetical protein F511_46458 [Dorcoceras hygrometricum]|uniref:Uncharacterized protein n=1 Tax=Dorcoceras hygrometricum TaxID=472368 RepID=A0A2Z6ZTI0_9LAMI|nr:hypothetical protein F511_46458 [Dorcoceras hygrometricum]
MERKTSAVGDIMLKFHPAVLAAEQKLPCIQITQFTVIQAILEIVASAKKIHLIDFGIRSGMHWSVMMQGLANRRNCTVKTRKFSSKKKK